jgi:RNA polymerase sigma factor (sigma-70 family)
MKQKNAAAPAQPDREMLSSLVNQHLKTLNRFVRHELAHFQAAGDLLPGDLTPEDVVDATLLRAYREFGKRGPAGHEISGWLIGLAREHLEAEVRRLKSERESTVHIEEDIPETPPQEQAATLGEEILYFYEPEEDLKLEDVIPDLTMPTPEQVLERKELRSCVNAALATMPRDWRRALLLYQVEGLAGAVLAEAVGRPAPEVPRILEQARNYLRQRLVESGCLLETGG